MDYDSCRSLPAMFFEQAGRLGDKPFLWAKRGGAYQAISWRTAASNVRRLALGLGSLGIGTGDRVALVAENRPEWVIADLAIMRAGAITVPAYVTNTVEDHRHIFGNSGARAVIVSKPPLTERVIAAAALVPSVQGVIAIEPADGARAWDEVLALGAAQPGDVAERVAALGGGDIACIIYTSGTGGLPKGVLLSHRNIIANCHGAYR